MLLAQSMDFNAIGNFVSTIGIPAFAFYLLYVFMKETQTKTTDALNELTSTITELKSTMEVLQDYIMRKEED